MGTRLIFLLTLLAAGAPASAQSLAEGERRGLVQATASLYPSWMLNHGVQNNYVAGHLMYCFDDRYSFRGEVLSYIDAQGDKKVLNDHVQLQAGFGRHFPVKRWDPFIYVQMGLGAVQLEGSNRRFCQPTAGVTLGAHYNVSRFFYFFAEAQYHHLQNPEYARSLDQVFVSGGLGFQFPTRKPG